MNKEEYKTIREEMLMRFKWTFQLKIWAIIVTGVLLSWIATQRSGTSSLKELNPYLFIAVGLGIVGYIFYVYHDLLEGIYNQGFI
ncbi:MAG: hypothetical protein JW878_01170 [Methanomicrobia archaeon]|nr:hypothetical protein [Methanomicrobia archaeon]